MANQVNNRDPGQFDENVSPLTGLLGAETKVYIGCLMVYEAGYLVRAKAAANLTTAGWSAAEVDNVGGVAGVKRIAVQRKRFKMFIHTGTPVTQAMCGTDVFVADDQTVAGSNLGGTLSAKVRLLELKDGMAVVEPPR